MDIAVEDFLLPLVVGIVLIVWAALEWYRAHTGAPPNPVGATIAAMLWAGYAGFKFWRAWPRLRALRQGRDGERGMAEVLDGLRESGYKVFHDILGEGFNLDHVLIGPTGVYTVETKTYTKPARGPAVVKFDGERITINGYEPDRNAIIQAKAQAQWLSRLLGEVTGRRIQVRPTVVYPGWHIDEAPKSKGEVWVLGTYGLKSFLPSEPNRLTREEVVALANQLSRAVRPADRP